MNLLELQNISKDYYKNDQSVQKVLSDINFSVKKGECFTIIGPNGSGKTTLLRITGLLEPPTKGKIYYSGKNITNLSKKEQVIYRRKFSFVRQKPTVLNTSIFNNIAYGLKVRNIAKNQRTSKVNEIIEIVGLKGLEKNNARNLSGGEIQRVVIAMNFVIGPELYLLDEISANLDPRNVTLLESFIEKIKRDKQKTIILSTHDRLEAIKFADRIGVLIDGTLSQIGTPDEIFTSPKYEFTAQFVGYENIFSGIAKIDTKSGLNHIKINDLTISAVTQKEGEVKVCIRPESISITRNPPANTSIRNTFKGKIAEIRELGNTCHITLICNSVKFLISITKLSRDKLGLKNNSEVYINFKATDVKCL